MSFLPVVGGLARMLGAMFLPKQHPRHAFASQLLVNAAIVRLHETADSPGGAQQAIVQCCLVQRLDLIPVQTCLTGQCDVLGDHAFRDAPSGLSGTISWVTPPMKRRACAVAPSQSASPSDFLTKELGLPWRDAAQILRKTFEHQMCSKVMMARGRAAASPLWREMKSEQLAGKPVFMQRLQAFDADTKANRASLFAGLKTEHAKALAGLTGSRRKAAQSLDKLQVATATATAKAEFSDARRALRKSLQPSQANAWRSFLQVCAQTGSEEALAALRKLDGTARAVPAQSITGTLYLDDEEEEKKRRRRARESLASILNMLTHSVEINGDITLYLVAVTTCYRHTRRGQHGHYLRLRAWDVDVAPRLTFAPYRDRTVAKAARIAMSLH